MIANKTTAALAVAATLLLPGSVHAQTQPTGVWIDHTGRGAVEITQCDKALCGHIVWLKDAAEKQACRTQVIGNVQPIGGGVWDRGWIVDPEDNKRYSVELKPIGNDRLRVVGYMGTKLLSETMTWRRAPADLQRCDVVQPDAPAAATVAVAPPKAAPKSAPKSVATAVNTAPPAAPAGALPAAVASPPVREASTPAPNLPSVTASPPPPVRTAIRTKKRKQVVASREVRRIERPRRVASRRGGGGSCGINLPYVSLRYPCNILSML